MPKKAYQPDATDIAIIVGLSADPKATNSAVARNLGVSEETVRRRLKRLITEAHIGYSITMAPRIFGFAENAILTVSPRGGYDDKVLHALKKQIGVTRAYRVLDTGGINIVAEVSRLDVDDLCRLLDTIDMVDGVEDVQMKRIIEPTYSAISYPL